MLSPDVIGRSGYECAARASREVDLILAVGSRTSDNNTAKDLTIPVFKPA